MDVQRVVSGDGQTVTVSTHGRLDVAMGALFWELCQPDACPYRRYVFDLGGVTEVRFSGIVWLRMFLRWARDGGVTVRLVQARRELEDLCVSAGISIENHCYATIADPPVDVGVLREAFPGFRS
jgi:hypothetical protein